MVGWNVCEGVRSLLRGRVIYVDFDSGGGYLLLRKQGGSLQRQCMLLHDLVNLVVLGALLRLHTAVVQLSSAICSPCTAQQQRTQATTFLA